MRCEAGLSAEWTHSPGHHFEWQRADSGAASQPSRSTVAMEHGIGWPKRFARPLGLPAIIINENGREIAYVGHHTGAAMNPLTHAVEPNGTSIVDVTDPANPKYLAHIPGSTQAGEEAGGAQMVRVCSGNVLPHGVRGKWYLLRPLGTEAQEIYDVTDPARPTRLTVIVEGLTGTHKSCGSAIPESPTWLRTSRPKAGRAAII